MSDYDVPHRLRCLLSTLAAGCIGVSIVAFYATLGWGLLGIAQHAPRDPHLIALALCQWLIACGAVVATIELARLQRLWLDLPITQRIARLMWFLLAWLVPAIAALSLAGHFDHPARGTLLVQGAGFVLVTAASELNALTRPAGFPSSPIRSMFRLLSVR